jgi:hypothetical protein
MRRERPLREGRRSRDEAALALFERFWPGLVVLAAGVFLLVRVAPDVHGKPLFEDEAIVAQISVHGIVGVLQTVIWDRGGAPLHFVLAHVVLLGVDSAAALRWLSVVAAVATLPVAFDLGRRVGGRQIGALAAVVCAASGLLSVVGSFGRMYALYALAGALACDLFVRAAQRPTRESLALAALAAWLLPATHPYGGILLALEALVAVVAWRGRLPRAALPAIAIMASAGVFLIADVRLSQRFEVGSHGRRAVATPSQALDQLTAAVRGFSGGTALLALLFAALAAVGLAWCIRNGPAFGAVAVLWLVVPPLLTLVARAPSVPSVKSEPRHLVSDLAAWAVLVALGSRAISARLPAPGRLVAFAAVGVLALASPVRARDIRTGVPFWAQIGRSAALTGPRDWVDAHSRSGGVLYPYSVVYLRTLGRASESTSLPRAEASPLLAALRRAHAPFAGLTMAIPLDGSRVDARILRTRLGPAIQVGTFPDWLVVEAPEPMDSPRAAVCRLRTALGAIDAALSPSAAARHELGLYLSVDQKALRATGIRC